MRDARDGFGIAEFLGLQTVEVVERVEALAAQDAAHAFGVGNEQDRIALGPALHALKHAGQESAAKGILAAIRLHTAGDERHEAGQVLVRAAEAVRHPRAHARPAFARAAGVEQQLRRRVVELVGGHRLDERDVVHVLRQLRHGVAHPRARLAVLRKFMRRAHQLRYARGEGKPSAFQVLVRTILAVAFLQLRLEVEHVQHRRRTGHVQVNDALGLGRKVRLARLERLCGIKRHVGRRGLRAAHDRGQRRGAQAHPRLAEKLPARAM